MKDRLDRNTKSLSKKGASNACWRRRSFSKIDYGRRPITSSREVWGLMRPLRLSTHFSGRVW